MKKIILSLLLCCLNVLYAQNINIIPAPQNVQFQNGNFSLSKNTVIVLGNNAQLTTANFLNNYLQSIYGYKLAIVKAATHNYIHLSAPTFIKKPDNEEAYVFNVTANEIKIQGQGAAGAFYGVQTLIQLLSTNTKNATQVIPCMQIQDAPRFKYRGMHLDVSRHFFPISYVKKYIDYIALHKMNYFHWHLTDDQGWRIEIKKYPKLTQIGAWRNGTIIGRFPGTGSDNIKHGGFYTQQQIKEVVQYAAQRHITILPEIEMPGHSMSVLAAYPEFSTTPQVRPQVPITWGLNGVVNNVFAPTEKTFSFLQDVLTEVMELFPSEMIHIGGDECSKIWWKKDSASQQLMRKENLKDEDELQSYFIQRIEKFVNSKGKKIIGWDEILEGGLAPNAAVMSWTGEKGGIHAAKEKHNVVMTPSGWCYFDHTQTKNEDSVTIGGYTSLEKVYSYEPIPKELNEEEGKYILGAQANVWTEYIAYPSKIEYMIFPRMSALSEVLWSKKESRNWINFEQRLQTQFKRYELWNANYSKAYYEIKSQITPTNNYDGVQLKLETKFKNGVLQYKNLNDKDDIGVADFIVVNDAIQISKSETITVQLTTNKQQVLSKALYNFKFNKATGKKITINPQPSSSYPADGAFTLVNGIQNTKGRMRDSEFIGYSGNNAEIIIDLGVEQNISSIVLHAFESNSSWIYAPAKMEVFFSTNGKDYSNFGTTNTFIPSKNGNGILSLTNTPANTKYLKIVVHNYGKISQGNNGAGHGAWMFLDEIEVN